MEAIEKAALYLALHLPCVVFGGCYCKSLELGHTRLAISCLVLAFISSPAIKPPPRLP